jgi:hypothetical protein
MMVDILNTLYKYSIHFGDEYIHNPMCISKNSEIFYEIFNIDPTTIDYSKFANEINVFKIENKTYAFGYDMTNSVILFGLYLDSIFTSNQNTYHLKEGIDHSKLIIENFQKYFINISTRSNSIKRMNAGGISFDP